MKIIVNKTGKAYNLTMQEWTGSNWSQDMAEDIIIDNSFWRDDEAEAWRMTGNIADLEDYLHDWEQYETETDINAYDEGERQLLRDEHPRSYELDEIDK